jgi:arginase family enzyme
MQRARDSLIEAGEPPGLGVVVNFLGSGDFHHLATALIEAVREPLTVLHFDNHPDCVRFAPQFHCGSWVNRVLDMKHVRQVITVGPCSDDLSWPQLKGGNLAALADGHLQLYPWRHAPSVVFGKVEPGPSGERRGIHLHWHCVGQDFAAFLSKMTALIGTDAVWVSIDKDVLRPADALTNWDQGEMPLTALTAALRNVAAGKRIVGVDICGDYSPIHHKALAKRWEAWTDQPHRRAHSTAELALNPRANAALLDTLRRAGA